MTTYIIKTVVCSALFLLIYHLFLEKEKMHYFNRFYLLCSVVLSFIIPAISITTAPKILPVFETKSVINTTLYSHALQQSYLPVNNNNHFINLLFLLYSAVTIYFFIKFIRNIAALFHTIKNTGKNTGSVTYFSAKLVLLNDNIIPYSFLNYIFISKEDFEKRAIEKEVLQHELTHVRQKHSIDILLLELLLTATWFNPFLYLFKKAIQLNHEFLADDCVIETFNDARTYQLLLLRKISQAGSFRLASRFNYLITKKRLVMMTKTTSRRVALLKQITLLPVIAGIVFMFSEKIVAQDTAVIKTKQQPTQNTTNAYVWTDEQEVSSTKEGASQELLNEYKEIINKYHLLDTGRAKKHEDNITLENKSRLETIFKQMSKTQQLQQTVFFVMPPHPFSKNTITKVQLESFKNAKLYGVWIDEKKVSNTALNNYTNTDFAHVFISKLYGAAKRNVSYNYQVSLMTKDYYQKYYDETIAHTDPILIVKQFFIKAKTSD